MKRCPLFVFSAILISLGSLLASPALGDEPAAAAPISHVDARPASASASPEPSDLAKEAGINPEIAQKLTGEQIFQILHQHNAPSDPGPVAIVVPFTLFLFLFLGISTGLYLSFRKDRERQETLRAMIQRGEAIPRELLVPPASPGKKFSDLRRGLLLVAGGLGTAIFVGVVSHDHGVWTVGLIPMLLGAGYLLTWKLTRLDAAAAKDEAQVAAEREVNSL